MTIEAGILIAIIAQGVAIVFGAGMVYWQVKINSRDIRDGTKNLAAHTKKEDELFDQVFTLIRVHEGRVGKLEGRTEGG